MNQKYAYRFFFYCEISGVNFAIDIPAALQDAMSSYYKLDQYQFSLFYTSYFLPSLFLGAFGGYLIDK